MTIRRIIEGFLEFRRDVLPSLAPLFGRLATNQEPSVLLLACADSRIVPGRILSSEPGEVFEMRTVGNLVAPSGATGAAPGDVSEGAAIEYAVGILEVRDIVILGHSSCGAMDAILRGRVDAAAAPNLAQWLTHASPSLGRRGEIEYAPGLGDIDRLSQTNVLVQIEHVLTYPGVRRAVDAGTTDIHGAWLDVGTGDLHLYDPAARAFRALDEEEGARRLAESPRSET